jgi:carbonic anhydrase
MLVDDILQRNRDWVRGRKPQPLPPVETLRLAVVGCYDPRLDRLLLPALGLEPGDAFLLRSAGALLQPGSTTMRSLGLAMFMFGVTEVLIVGHAACRMAAFDTAAFIEEFRRRGVPREAFGDDSLRTWAGAIPSPRQGVLQSVATVREAPFVPKDVRVAGVVLDEKTGALELVVRPDQEAGAFVSVSSAATTTSAAGYTTAEDSAAAGVGARHAAASEAAASRAAASHAGPGASPRRAATGGAAPPPPPGAATHAQVATAASSAPATSAATSSRTAPTRALLHAVEDFLGTIESKEHWKADVENLRQELERRRDPRQRLELLDAFARRLGGESREVAESFARLRREITAAGADPAAELLSVFHHLGRRR